MIISLSGFSSDIQKQAIKDGIKLIGPEDLRETFKKTRHFELIEMLEKVTNGNN